MRPDLRGWILVGCVALMSALAGCTQVIEFDRDKITESASNNDDDGGVPMSGVCDPETHEGCQANQLCCGGACVAISMDQCTACGVACDTAVSTVCSNRECRCGAGDACEPGSAAPICRNGTCLGCAEDADCATDATAKQCVDNVCAECDPADGTCMGEEPVCDPTTKTCEKCSREANNCPNGLTCTSAGACVGCDPSDDSGCSGTTDQCNPANEQCVQCLSTEHCEGRTPICQLTEVLPFVANACRPCSSNAECEARTPGTFCVTIGEEDGACAECDPADDEGCSGGDQCDPDTRTCVECLTNAQCSGTTPVCDTANHMCEPCDSSSDCGGRTCLPSGACGACDAVSNAGCTGSTPYCTNAMTCVECEVSSNCAGSEPICTGNTCGPCTTNQQCADRGVAGATYCVTSGGLDNSCGACDPADHEPCTGTTPVCRQNGLVVQCSSCTAAGATSAARDAACAAVDPDEPACQSDGSCGECNSNDDCDSGEQCRTSDGTCVDCVIDSGCSATSTTPFCGTNNTCAACTTEMNPDSACNALTTGTVCRSNGSCGDPSCTLPNSCTSDTRHPYCVDVDSTAAVELECRACDPTNAAPAVDDGCTVANPVCTVTATGSSCGS